MESTAPEAVRQAVLPFPINARSLAAAFLRVPDPRRVASVAYPLAAVLSLAVAAILAKGLSELAIAQWGGGSERRVPACGCRAGAGGAAGGGGDGCPSRWAAILCMRHPGTRARESGTRPSATSAG